MIGQAGIMKIQEAKCPKDKKKERVHLKRIPVFNRTEIVFPQCTSQICECYRTIASR
jgi:hypothetical protein